MAKIILVCILTVVSLASCFKLSNSECADDIICTQIFVSVTVDVSDEKGKPVFVSRTETRSLDGSFLVSRTVNSVGPLVIADDLDRKKLAKEGTPVSFKAFIQVKGQEIQVLDQAFIIGHDCCHIIKMGGPDQINLNCTDLVKCAMDNDSGMCDAAIPKAYFDKASGKCKTFIWGGCGPYPFDTIEDCEACGCK